MMKRATPHCHSRYFLQQQDDWLDGISWCAWLPCSAAQANLIGSLLLSGKSEADRLLWPSFMTFCKLKMTITDVVIDLSILTDTQLPTATYRSQIYQDAANLQQPAGNS